MTLDVRKTEDEQDDRKVRALVAASVPVGVEVTPADWRAISNGLVGLPEDEHAAAVARYYAGPDCRACTVPGAQATHEYYDGAWLHDIEVGEFPTTGNDFADEPGLPLVVSVTRFPDCPASINITCRSWSETVLLDLEGVREALRVLSAAEALLVADAETDAGSVQTPAAPAVDGMVAGDAQ